MTINEIAGYKPSSEPGTDSDIDAASPLAKALGRLQNCAEAMDELLACQAMMYSIQNRAFDAARKFERHPHFVRNLGVEPIFDSLIRLYEAASYGCEEAYDASLEPSFRELNDAVALAQDAWMCMSKSTGGPAE